MTLTWSSMSEVAVWGRWYIKRSGRVRGMCVCALTYFYIVQQNAFRRPAIV